MMLVWRDDIVFCAISQSKFGAAVRLCGRKGLSAVANFSEIENR